MKKLLLTLILVLNYSCKENTKEKKIVEKMPAPKALTIDFSFKTNKTDKFTIMLNNIEVDELQMKNIHFFEDVNPSSSYESINAKFDSGNISKNIIFNLGNKEVKEVELKNILISYGNKEFNIGTIAEIYDFLQFNKFIVKDSTSNTIKTKRVDGKHNPTFSIKRKLINKLIKD